MNLWKHDARLDPTPGDGFLGPVSGLDSGNPITVPRQQMQAPWAALAAVLAALVILGMRSEVARAGWHELQQHLPFEGKPEPVSPAILSQHEFERLGAQKPQQQAELLLERAVNHSQGAIGQIDDRVDGWHGRLHLTPQLSTLITAGLNSNDLQVRGAAIEVDLAALGINKNSQSITRLEKQAQAGAQQQRIWALWTLGLLGNRGIEPGRADEVLDSALGDPDPEIRHWAVEGISYLGTDQTIPPLLKTLRDDPSPMVRERAACALAQSGMLREEQRRTAVPTLLAYAEDSSLDTQTHAWVYHALRDITGQRLPDSGAAWRGWWETENR